MENNKAKSCLRTFLEVSKIQIDEREKKIKRKKALKSIFDSSRKRSINREISVIREEMNQIQGKLDSVRLEILVMILEDPTLISQKMISKKGYSSSLEFVINEMRKIELRGLYKKYPCSIADVLNVGLTATKDDFRGSLFDSPQTEATKTDIMAAVDAKNVKIMTKSM